MKYYYYCIAIILYLILSITAQKATTINPSKPDTHPTASEPTSEPLANITQKDYDSLLANVKMLTQEIDGLKNTIKAQEVSSKENMRMMEECLINLVNSLAMSVKLPQKFIKLEDFDQIANGFISKTSALGVQFMVKLKALQDHLDIYQHKLDSLSVQLQSSQHAASR